MKSISALRQQNGVVLVFVLWVVVLLSAIAGNFIVKSDVETKITSNAVDRLKVYALAEKGVFAAVLKLVEISSNNHIKYSVEKEFIKSDGDSYSYSISYESGKIDINYAGRALIKEMFVQQDLGEKDIELIVDSILDWRDPDKLRRLNGAEDLDYKSAGYNYQSKDQHFDTIEELKLLMGMNNDIYSSIESLITVDGYSARINPVYASEKVLRVIPNLSNDEFVSFVSLRDSNIIQAKKILVYSPSANFFTYESNNIFRIKSQGKIKSGAKSCIDAVVLLSKKTNRPFEFLKWRNGC